MFSRLFCYPFGYHHIINRCYALFYGYFYPLFRPLFCIICYGTPKPATLWLVLPSSTWMMTWTKIFLASLSNKYYYKLTSLCIIANDSSCLLVIIDACLLVIASKVLEHSIILRCNKLVQPLSTGTRRSIELLWSSSKEN